MAYESARCLCLGPVSHECARETANSHTERFLKNCRTIWLPGPIYIPYLVLFFNEISQILLFRLSTILMTLIDYMDHVRTSLTASCECTVMGICWWYSFFQEDQKLCKCRRCRKLFKRTLYCRVFPCYQKKCKSGEWRATDRESTPSSAH